jgi:hypothetical protein
LHTTLSHMQHPRIASIGFRAKLAKAIAIVVEKNPSGCTFVGRWDLRLYDPAEPATGQPHHEAMELPWDEACVIVQRLERRIEGIASTALAKISAELQSNGFVLNAAGIVGSPDRNLERIGNRHIRAHAAEGILFRRVLESASKGQGLRCLSFSDRTLSQIAASEVGAERLKSTLVTLGKSAGKPWRVDERLAASAAWLALM